MTEEGKKILRELHEEPAQTIPNTRDSAVVMNYPGLAIVQLEAANLNAELLVWKD
jgi:hypothetical protein